MLARTRVLARARYRLADRLKLLLRRKIIVGWGRRRDELSFEDDEDRRIVVSRIDIFYIDIDIDWYFCGVLLTGRLVANKSNSVQAQRYVLQW